METDKTMDALTSRKARFINHFLPTVFFQLEKPMDFATIY